MVDSTTTPQYERCLPPSVRMSSSDLATLANAVPQGQGRAQALLLQWNHFNSSNPSSADHETGVHLGVNGCGAVDADVCMLLASATGNPPVSAYT